MKSGPLSIFSYSKKGDKGGRWIDKTNFCGNEFLIINELDNQFTVFN